MTALFLLDMKHGHRVLLPSLLDSILSSNPAFAAGNVKACWYQYTLHDLTRLNLKGAVGKRYNCNRYDSAVSMVRLYSETLVKVRVPIKAFSSSQDQRLALSQHTSCGDKDNERRKEEKNRILHAEYLEDRWQALFIEDSSSRS